MDHCTSPEKNTSITKKRQLSINYFISLMSLCAKQARRVSKTLKRKHLAGKRNADVDRSRPPPFDDWGPMYVPKSPIRVRSKELISNVSHKAMMLVRRKSNSGRDKDKTGFGDGGVWQRDIMMGDKCQPLDFSGVIYYDHNGRQLEEVPTRSPRVSPLPRYLGRGTADKDSKQIGG